LGINDLVPLDEEMENTDCRDIGGSRSAWRSFVPYLAVLLFAAAVYLGCMVSPPSLMDDVDAVQAQIARNMLSSADWVTARLDGIPYLEKSPLIYWLIAISFKIFGFTDWAARIPVAAAAIGLALLTCWFAGWAFGKLAAFYAGICMATCVGLFLFTRILIPDVMLTVAITLAVWSILRALDEEERHPAWWVSCLGVSLGTGLLLKSLIAVVFPVGAGALYLLATRQLLLRNTWRRLKPGLVLLLALLIAAPWHVLATLRNPPYLVWTMRSAPGEYHGFFWFYFINEQLLRFLNLRYPRDYDTVPLGYFWLFHLLWLFPWSVYLPCLASLSYRPIDRAGKTRLMAACLALVVLVFFSFSTTQEYYSMPCYPALALLLASGMNESGPRMMAVARRVLAAVSIVAATIIAVILALVRNAPSSGDISSALTQHPAAYTLSLGHMEDLTLDSFAYLRIPLVLAGVSFLIGGIGNLLYRNRNSVLATGIMMVLFFQAARLAMVVFDPYLSSRPLADALLKSPAGTLIVDHHYYTFSSIFFYTNRTALLRNGRIQNLVYGSYAPGAPDIFIDDRQFATIWSGSQRAYIIADHTAVPKLAELVGQGRLATVRQSGGKVLLTNQPL
jgi:4-amino-4-deoxy-L-arabinose transferase-like glycosyltransferase